MTALLQLETKSEANEDEAAGFDEVKAALDALTGDFQKKTAPLADLTERLAKLEAKANRPAANDNRQEEPAIERKAFASFLKFGEQRMPAEEAKALVVADDTRGGYLAPAEFSTEIIRNLVQFSPVRQAARVGSTAASSVILPKRTGTPTASWVGETETRTGTESAYGQIEIPIHEMAAYVDVSVQLLEDAAVNVEAEVASDLAEEFGRLEGSSLLNGDGVKKPLGLMSATGIDFSVSGSAAAITADGLIDLVYGLPAFYRNTGAFMMNGTTLAALRKLKDGQGNYLWQPSYAAGQPETILSRPVVEAVDMPDIAAGTFPVVFGDFMRAFRIYDRAAMSILRDPYSLATTGKVRFHARRRVGAATVQSEAVRKLKIAAS
ncbi:phage major capsid protein [Aurantimonas sp. E1-2-R+4]|uniref:phage major capsid protein n=1 Tax=Aurantimonas sp. E1-2-R+4 TaxID=3113714 RepID=UPI002F93AAFA